MKEATAPRLHLFVCTNRRDDSPLGPGCGERGDALYEVLKGEVARSGRVASVWITRTQCLGVCPARGSAVARYPGPCAIATEAELADVPTLLAEPPDREASHWDAIEPELFAMETLQTQKVLDLARRLRPGLTMEDVQNPHDFPELMDTDWHYTDGVLTGIKTVISALRALRQRMSGGT